ncbi:hypothetical protein MKEN_00173400 [Mycena kentingensis (nom. inval.)]|nr:hypothetical protein MKEN_00173400 [Mycena kentingensis (nom. inval.)]
MSDGSSFLLSNRAAAQSRNFHLFSSHQHPRVIMAGGWDLNRHPLTASKFFRWLTLVDGPRKTEIAIQRLDIVRVDVLRYGFGSCHGPLIKRESEELLEPGIYGVVTVADGTPFPWRVGVNYNVTFERLDQVFANVHPAQPLRPGIALQDIENQIPNELAALVASRDKGKCCISGRSDLPTTVTWVFPPRAGYNLEKLEPVTVRFEDYRVPENLVTICSSLVDSFNRNLFSVDIEDSNRIIEFADLLDGTPQLPRQMPKSQRVAGSDKFWLLSFAYTIKVHFPGGDPGPDYRKYDAREWAEDLSKAAPDLADPKWQTPFGREVLGAYREQELRMIQFLQQRCGPEELDPALFSDDDVSDNGTD